MTQARIEKLEDITFECPISGAIMEKPTQTHCGHTFEEDNIKEWINRSEKKDAHGNPITTCPCCHEQITLAELRRNYQLQAVLPFIKKQQMENSALKSRLNSLEVLQHTAIKSDRKITAMEHDLTNAKQTVSAINNLQEQQIKLLEQRKTLITTTMPLIKDQYKKLAFVSQRLKAFENKTNEIKMMDLSELESDVSKQYEKYKIFHTAQANKTRVEIIEPYLKKLETLNSQITKNENDLRTLKASQLNMIEKSAKRARLMPALSLSIFGGTGKLKKVLEVKTPATTKASESTAKPTLKITERAKQTELLMNAVKSGNTEQALLALQNGANPNFTTASGIPFIISAVKQKKLDLVAILLEYKSNVNATDANRNSALHWAAYYNQVPLVLTLLENGIDPRIRSIQDITADGETANLLIKDTIIQAIHEFEAKERALLRA
ncbi:MAG: ankyrin repeat domain-containing protein [Gammaproteobacteria bacterium]